MATQPDYACIGRLWGHDLTAYESGEIGVPELRQRALNNEAALRHMKKFVGKLLAEPGR